MFFEGIHKVFIYIFNCVSASVQNIYNHYYKRIHSSAHSLSINSSSRRSTLNHRDKSMKLLSKEFLVNNDSHLSTLNYSNWKVSRARYSSLTRNSKG